jgi:hypothetical protein
MPEQDEFDPMAEQIARSREAAGQPPLAVTDKVHAAPPSHDADEGEFAQAEARRAELAARIKEQEAQAEAVAPDDPEPPAPEVEQMDPAEDAEVAHDPDALPWDDPEPTAEVEGEAEEVPELEPIESADLDFIATSVDNEVAHAVNAEQFGVDDVGPDGVIVLRDFVRSRWGDSDEAEVLIGIVDEGGELVGAVRVYRLPEDAGDPDLVRQVILMDGRPGGVLEADDVIDADELELIRAAADLTDDDLSVVMGEVAPTIDAHEGRLFDAPPRLGTSRGLPVKTIEVALTGGDTMEFEDSERLLEAHYGDVGTFTVKAALVEQKDATDKNGTGIERVLKFKVVAVELERIGGYAAMRDGHE